MPFKKSKMTRRPRRKMGGRRKFRRSGGTRTHAPKVFVSSFKYQDVVATPFGTHINDYGNNQLSVTLSNIPLFSTLSGMYRQFAITSVKFEYRPTLNMANTGTATLSQIVVSENKDADQALPVTNVLAEDNCRKYVSSRKWSLFVKKPRPALYQQDYLGNRIKVISAAKNLHWLSRDEAADVGLNHLAGQMCVQDVEGASGNVRQGELWCKVYLACKEQSL